MNKPLLSVCTWMTTIGFSRAGARLFALLALLSAAPAEAYVAEAHLSSAATSSAEQAKQPISGIVVDKDGSPLVGVTVMEKNTTNGTTTDGKGQFKLTVDPNSVLKVSYLGYEPQELPVGNKTSFKVELRDNSQEIDEVVVTAYSSQKKMSVTGSVSSVQSKELKQSSSASLSTALAGRLSGITSLQQGGGQPGKDQSTMMLRGAATTNGKTPLILIDGVPRDNMDYLSADEVDNISVLKDASATAVFGVRGANGAILITTKRGTTGKAKLDVRFEQSWTSFTREPRSVSALDYIRMKNEALYNDHKEGAMYQPDVIAKYADPLKGLDPNDPDYAKKAAQMQYLYPSHDYYRELIKKYTPQTRVDMNITGGTEKLKYFAYAGYLHQGGNLNVEPKSQLGYDPSAKMDRYSFRSNLDYQVTKSFKAFLRLGSYIEQVNMPSASAYPNRDEAWMMRDLIYQATTVTPITPGPYVDPYSGLTDKALVYAPYLDRMPMEVMNRQGYHTNVNTNLNSTFGAEWDLGFITKGLSIQGMASYDVTAATKLDAQQRELLYTVTNIDDVPNYGIYTNQEYSPLSIQKWASSNYKINLQASVNYNRTFGRHSVGALLLGQRDYWEDGGQIPFNIVGMAFRTTYSFDDRYLVEFNMGYNGSEQFAPDNRFGFFPAISAGWVISNEKFLKGNSTLSLLKLRASYGKVGNDKLGDNRFLYLDNITMGGGTLGSLGNGQGVSAGLLGNPTLSWETEKQQNYGFDLQLWGRLNLSFDYFVKNREGILIDRKSVPMIQGTPLGNIPKMNLGKVKNQGFEIELHYTKQIIKDLTMEFRGTFNYNKNNQIFMDEPINPEDYVYRYRNTGVPLNTNWGYKIDYSNGNGFFNTQEELDEYLSTTSYSFGTPGLGDFKYTDLNGDGVVNEKDQVPLKYTKIPRITYGFSVGLDYKGIDFTLFFQGVSKYSNFSGVTQNIYEWTKEGTYYDYHFNAWTKERYANGEKITYPALHTGDNVNSKANDFFVFDRSFIRLKNIELGYTLPQRWLKSIGISRLRVYVSGQNLWTHSSQVANHIDPELDDPIGYPITKMMNVGVNLTF